MTQDVVACYGEAFVDYLLTGLKDLPTWGSSMPFSAVTKHPGGNAVNCAIGIAKLGRASSLPIVKIGQDADADFIRKGLIDGNISPGAIEAGVVVDQTMRTPSVVVLVQKEKNADRAFLHSNPYPYVKEHGGFGSPTVKEMLARLRSMKDVRFHHFAGVGNFDALTRPEIVGLVRKIRQTIPDSVITADTVPVANLQNPTVRLALKQFLDIIDYFMPSDFEAAMLTDNSDFADYEKSAAALRQQFRCKNIIIKIHERGAYLLEGDQASVVHPYYLANPTDSTGAGDAWCAGFLSGLVDGRTAIDSCELGNAAAHYAIQAVGATSNIPLFENIAEVVRDHQSSRLQIFISHSDVTAARSCAKTVAAAGATPILDDTHLKGGRLESKVLKMLKASNAVIILVSRDALKSDWVKFELDHARGLGLNIYPIKTASFSDSKTIRHSIRNSVIWTALHRDLYWSEPEALEAAGMRRLLDVIRSDINESANARNA
jgi:sugar/nucleoside kinase (ribokinase family)